MDLRTRYLGFELPHPFIPGASPLVELCVRDVLKAIEFPAADRPSAHRLTLRGP